MDRAGDGEAAAGGVEDAVFEIGLEAVRAERAGEGDVGAGADGGGDDGQDEEARGAAAAGRRGGEARR